MLMELTGKKVAAVHYNVCAKKRNSYVSQSNITVAQNINKMFFIIHVRILQLND